MLVVVQTSFAQLNTNGQLNLHKYNEITFLTTHNAFNNKKDGFGFPNQNYDITRQLTDGIKALMIDVYEKNNELVVYHGNSMLGYKKLEYVMSQVSDFLENNPNEIVTIIFECYTTANKIENALINANLLKYVYTNSNVKVWPTIAQMIETNQRLVIFSDKDDASNSQSWYHHIWKYAVETTFEAKDTSDFSSKYQRGKPTNPLFIVNHFLTTNIGTGFLSKAKTVNSNPYLEKQLTEIELETGKKINFLTVDFYDIGDCIKEVYKMNGINWEQKIYFENYKILFYPNPVKSKAHIIIPDSTKVPYYYTISTIHGKSLFQSEKIWQKSFDVNTENLSCGVYIFTLIDSNYNKSTRKFVKMNE